MDALEEIAQLAISNVVASDKQPLSQVDAPMLSEKLPEAQTLVTLVCVVAGEGRATLSWLESAETEQVTRQSRSTLYQHIITFVQAALPEL